MVDQGLMERIKAANVSWSTHIVSELHDIQYDNEADILYLGYGQPREAFSLPIGTPDEDIHLRIDVDTHEIVGINILGFREVLLDKHQDAREAFNPFFELLGDSDWRFQIRLPSERDDAQFALFMPASRPFLEYFPAYIPKVAPNLVPA